MVDERLLTGKDVPKFLPPEYFRECADEDGAMQKYKVVTDVNSYLEGAKAQAKHTGELAEAVIVWMCYFAQRQERERLGWELEELGLVTPAHDGCCIISLGEHRWWRAIMNLRHGQSLRGKGE